MFVSITISSTQVPKEELGRNPHKMSGLRIFWAKFGFLNLTQK